MALDVFPLDIGPSFGVNKSTQPRVVTNAFGDGYFQRASDGINPILENWDLTWNNLTKAEADIATEFFEDKKGVTAFLWTAPDNDTQKKYICTEWSREIPDAGARNIKAKFAEVADL